MLDYHTGRCNKSLTASPHAGQLEEVRQAPHQSGEMIKSHQKRLFHGEISAPPGWWLQLSSPLDMGLASQDIVRVDAYCAKISGRTRTGCCLFRRGLVWLRTFPVVVLARLAVLGPVGARRLFSFVDVEDRYQERRPAGPFACVDGSTSKIYEVGAGPACAQRLTANLRRSPLHLFA
jgi:hypothetical protein